MATNQFCKVKPNRVYRGKSGYITLKQHKVQDKELYTKYDMEILIL